MTFRTTLSLGKGDRHVGIQIQFNNLCQNHRLRMLFPSGTKGKVSEAEVPFDVVKRPFSRDESNPYRAYKYLSFPCHRFVGIRDETRSLALIVNGLHEYEIYDDSKRTLGLTLMRAFTNGICTYAEKELELRPGDLAQSPGRHHVRLAVTFLPPGEGYAHWLRLAEDLTSPLLAAEGRALPGYPEPSSALLPLSHSFLSCDDPAIAFSALKRGSRNPHLLILRLFYMGDTAKTATITFAGHVERMEPLTLNEEPYPKGEEPPVVVSYTSDRTLAKVTWKPKQIVTLAFTPPRQR